MEHTGGNSKTYFYFQKKKKKQNIEKSTIKIDNYLSHTSISFFI